MMLLPRRKPPLTTTRRKVSMRGASSVTIEAMGALLVPVMAEAMVEDSAVAMVAGPASEVAMEADTLEDNSSRDSSRALELRVSSRIRGRSATTKVHPRPMRMATGNVTVSRLNSASLRTRDNPLPPAKMLTATSSPRDSTRREATSMLKGEGLALVAKL